MQAMDGETSIKIPASSSDKSTSFSSTQIHKYLSYRYLKLESLLSLQPDHGAHQDGIGFGRWLWPYQGCI